MTTSEDAPPELPPSPGQPVAVILIAAALALIALYLVWTLPGNP